MNELQLWGVTTAIVVLLGLVGYFWRRSKNLEDTAIVTTIRGVNRSVDRLSSSIETLATKSEKAFKDGERRMDSLERRVAEVKTRCDIFHGTERRVGDG